ncbi:hypothetical protein QZH41_011786, partial [Actinostola sp. cb2023]
LLRAAMPQGKDDKEDPLTDNQKKLLRDSWALASEPSVQTGTKMFKILFQLAPATASYFSSTDITADDFQQHIKLVMGTLGTAIDNLDDLSVIVPGLQRLGATHTSLGVKKEHLK